MKPYTKKLTWTVEFSVDPSWVADGFDLDDERAHLMIQHDLGYAYPSETSAKVVKAPSADLIAGLQDGTIETE